MRFRSTIGCNESDFAITHSVTTAEIPIHSHSEYAVSYFFRGPCRCALESRHYMEFHPGDVGLLNPGEAHEDFASSDVREYVTVRIKKHFIRSLLNDTGYSPAAMPMFPTMKLSAGPDLSRICDQMRAELQVEQFGRDTVLDGLVAEMAVLLFRHFRPVDGDQDARSSREDMRPEIRRAVEFLHDNYTRRFSLDLLASAAGLSKYHLDRIFKQATGVRPHTYMVNLRIEAAKRLLTDSAKPATEIALELGFSDQSHFSNVFKQFTGVSPQSYRSVR